MNTENRTPKRRGKVAPYLKNITLLVAITAAFCLLVLTIFPGSAGQDPVGGNGNGQQDLAGGNADSMDQGTGNGAKQERLGGSNEADPRNGTDQQGNNAPDEGADPQENPSTTPFVNDDIKQIGEPETKKPQPAPQPKRAQNTKGTGLGKDGRGFFGKKLDPQENVWFIVDLSSSMSGRTSENITRVEALKLQLKNAVSTMYRVKSRKKYGIQPFGNSNINNFPDKDPFKRFSDDPADVNAYIDTMFPYGNTPMMSAWIKALKVIHDNEIINTVYFLSDGEPNDCSEQELLEFLRNNVPKNIKIHTYAIGHQSNLMEQIAQEHNGTCTTYL